ncbi:MAG: DegT/DnrJ/EryC1/StrS family aminotransferase, partial [Anaerolineae bacterium]
MGKDAKSRTPDGRDLRGQIQELVTEYYLQAHALRPFTPGETRVNYASRVYDERELMAAVDACLDFWLSAGPNAATFERRLAEYVGVSCGLAVNSGSSANLIAVSALLSRRAERPLESGDEVITPAAAFPTTVAPIVQNGLVPVFVDCELGTYNLDPEQLE